MFQILGFNVNDHNVIMDCGHFPTPHALGYAIMEMMKRNKDVVRVEVQFFPRKDKSNDNN